MIQRGRSPPLEWTAFSHFGSDPPHWNSKSKYPRYCRSEKGWNSAPCKEPNFEKQANALVIKGLWKCEQSHKACIIKSLAHNMLPYGQITSKQGLGSDQNQLADEMQQKRPKKGAKSLFWWSWQHFLLSCLWRLGSEVSPEQGLTLHLQNWQHFQTAQKCNPGVYLCVWAVLPQKVQNRVRFAVVWRNNVPLKPMLAPW